jgi:hypothetical protein
MNGRMKKFLVLLLALLRVFISFTPSVAQIGTVVRVRPTLITMQPGDTETIEIWVDDVVALYGFAVEIHFDPAKLSAGSTELGEFLELGMIAKNEIDNVNGIIEFDMAQFGSEISSKSGSGVLLRFDITMLEALSKTDIMIHSILLTDRDSFEIPCDVEDGIVRMSQYDVFLPLAVR